MYVQDPRTQLLVPLLSRVDRVNPNPNPNFRVPEFSGFEYFQRISGFSFQNPKFLKPEKPNPKFSGNPNAQPYPQAWPRPPSSTAAMARGRDGGHGARAAAAQPRRSRRAAGWMSARGTASARVRQL